MKQLFIVILIAFNFQIIAQTPFPKDNLDKVINALIALHKIPNSVIAITNKDSIIYTFSTPKNSIDDVFLIGSNTKSFTALAILQLADKGLIDIDKPIRNYLNGFSFANETNDKKITVRHLLNQTSGIPTSGGFYEGKTDDFGIFQKEYYAYLKTLTSVSEMGTEFHYSNANYLLLGLIIQKLSGKSYANYLYETVLNPLKMSHSFATCKDALTNDLIQSYQYALLLPIISTNKKYNDFNVPEGRLASTASDMCRYLQSVMKNGVGVGLKDSTYKMMLTPAKDGYAMGWGETHYFNQQVIQHLGLNENFNAAMFFMPQQNYGVIALANTNSMEFSGEIKEAIIKNLLNKPYSIAGFSIELIQRMATFGVLLLVVFFFLINLFRWKKTNFSINKPSFGAIIWCIISIGLSLLPVLLVPKMNNITLEAMTRFSPDYAYGFIGIAILGTVNALMTLVRKKKDPSV